MISRYALASSLVVTKFLAILSLLALLSPGVVAQSVPELPQVGGGGETPDFPIKMVSGGPRESSGDAAVEMKLSSLNGRVVLLDVFSSKCPHCIDHAPRVAEFYKQFRQQGFTVVGLATDQPDRAADVTSFIATAGITYPVGFMSAEVMVYFLDRRNHGVPQMVLFGKDGKMAKRLVGWSETTGPELRAAIEAELVKPSPRAVR